MSIGSRLKEDGPFNEITVEASGKVRTHCPDPASAGTLVEDGRRHRIALSGYCEECGHDFALVFTQHKGDTIIEWAKPTTPVRR